MEPLLKRDAAGTKDQNGVSPKHRITLGGERTPSRASTVVQVDLRIRRLAHSSPATYEGGVPSDAKRGIGGRAKTVSRGFSVLTSTSQAPLVSDPDCGVALGEAAE